jgi:hypothetical protein
VLKYLGGSADHLTMSELSTMLGDVYSDRNGDSASAPTGSAAARPRPRRRAGTLPDWADEDVLDAAFAEWVPGPPSSAPAAERSMLTDLATAREQPAEVALPNLAPPPSEPAVSETPVAAVEAAGPEAVEGVQTQPAAQGTWHRELDDILPARSRAPRASFRIR